MMQTRPLSNNKRWSVEPRKKRLSSIALTLLMLALGVVGAGIFLLHYGVTPSVSI